MIRTPPRLPLPWRPHLTLRAPPLPGIKSPASGSEIDELEPLVLGPKRTGLAHEHSRFRYRNRPRPHLKNVRQWRLFSRSSIAICGSSFMVHVRHAASGLCETVLIMGAGLSSTSAIGIARG